MKAIIDFGRDTLPWFAIGLFVACSFVEVRAKKEGEKTSRLFQGLSWSPAFCFLFVALMELYSGNTTSGITWLVLGAFNAVVNFANSKQKTQEKKEN